MKYCKIFMPRKEILCKKLHTTGKILVTGSNFQSQGEISYHSKKNYCEKKKYPLTGQNFKAQKEISCHREKFLVRERHFLLQEEMSQKEISPQRTKFQAKRRYFLREEISF